MAINNKRHPGYDNCKSLFMMYVVLWHMLNGWYLEESIQNWPPFWAKFFRVYSLWHEKLAVPGFAFLSGYFGKRFRTFNGVDSIERWKQSISTLFFGALCVQVFEKVLNSILTNGMVLFQQQGKLQVPSSIQFWDHLETWYLLALLIWRLMTPVLLELFHRPLFVSLVLAFWSLHLEYGWPAELRMRLFRFFPYYVAGLVIDKSVLDDSNTILSKHQTMMGLGGVLVTFGASWILAEDESNRFLGLAYFDVGWDWQLHLIILFQYCFCAVLVLSVVLLVRQIPFQLFPFTHSNSTLAIYVWHWQCLKPLLWGALPFSDENFDNLFSFGGSKPFMRWMQDMSDYPLLAILIAHAVSYIICMAIGSIYAWRLFRYISAPDCEWMFRTTYSKEFLTTEDNKKNGCCCPKLQENLLDKLI